MLRLSRTGLRNFRCHAAVDLTLPDVHWIVLAGRNGAGKTSLLEAIFSALRGRSFRATSSADVIKAGEAEAHVTLQAVGVRTVRVGAAFGRSGRALSLDGDRGAGLAAVAAAVPVEYIGAEAYRLVGGPPAVRRQFLDWLLFHVEPEFLPVWKAWHRAHRQRNELLRRGEENLAPWTRAVALHGERLTQLRASGVRTLQDFLVGGTGPAEDNGARLSLVFRPGWRDASLTEAFRRTAARERQSARAVVGPQYDDWSLGLGERATGQLSRGQIKMASLRLIRARAAWMDQAGRLPILLVDDLTADLDPDAVHEAVAILSTSGGQIWLSTLPQEAGLPLPGSDARFHVEPGRLTPTG